MDDDDDFVSEDNGNNSGNMSDAPASHNVTDYMNEKSPEYYLAILNGTKNMDKYACQTVVHHPNGGKLCLYLIDEFRKKSDVYNDMDEKRLRKCFRADGYRWGNSSGSKLLKIGIYREYNGMWSSEGRLDSRFVRKMYYHPDHPRVIVHYLGDHVLAERILKASVHGNATGENPNRFTMTSPALLDEAMEAALTGKEPIQVYRTSVNKEDGHYMLRNNKQVQNLKANYVRKMGELRDWAYNLVLMGDSLQFDHSDEKFIGNFQVPQLYLPMIAEPLIEEAIRMASETRTRYPLVFHYDTQFCIGDYYLSSFLFRHNVFQGDPSIPVMFLAHETKHRKGHMDLAKNLFSRLPARIKRLIVVSDMEFDFTEADDRCIHLYCWKHVKDALERQLVVTKCQSIGGVVNLFDKLKFIDNEKEFDEKWEAAKKSPLLSAASEEKTVRYLETVFKRWKQYSAVWRLKEAGYPDPESGCYNNAAESLNALIKKLHNRQVPPDIIVPSLHFLSVYYINELKRARRKMGKNLMKLEFDHLSESPISLGKLQYVPDYKEILNHCLNAVKQDKEQNDKPRDSRAINAVANTLSSNSVQMLEGGRFMVNDGAKSFVVQMGIDNKGKVQLKCTCNYSCLHEIAARKFANLDGKPGPSNVGKLMRQKRVANHHRRSGQKRPRIIDNDKPQQMEDGGDIGSDVDDNVLGIADEFPDDVHLSPILDGEEVVVSSRNDSMRQMDLDLEDNENPNDIAELHIIEQEKEIEDKVTMNASYYDGIMDWFTSLKKFMSTTSLPIVGEIEWPSFLLPLKAPDSVGITIFMDHDGNVAAARMCSNHVLLISPAPYTEALCYLSTSIDSRKLDSVKVKVEGVQKVANSNDQLRLLGAFLCTIANGENPAYYEYDLSGFLTSDDMHATRVKRTKKMEKSFIKQYMLYCDCRKPWTDTLTDDMNEFIGIPNLIECERCKKWFFVECVKYAGEEAFECLKCTAPFKVPLSKSNIAYNTCSIDAFLAILCSHTDLYANYHKYWNMSDRFIRQLRCGVQLIKNGLQGEGKDYFLPALIEQLKKQKQITRNAYNKIDLDGSEDINYLNYLKNSGWYVREDTSTCSSANCRCPHKSRRSTSLNIRRKSKTETWEELMDNAISGTPSTKCGSDSIPCSGSCSTASTYTSVPYFLPFACVNKPEVIRTSDVMGMPVIYEVQGAKYVLAGAGLSSPGHFQAAINHGGQWFIYDGLDPTPLKKVRGLHTEEATYVYYFRIE